MDVVEQQTENLELHTNALQILLGEQGPSQSYLSLPYSAHPTPNQSGNTVPSSLLCPCLLHSA